MEDKEVFSESSNLSFKIFDFLEENLDPAISPEIVYVALYKVLLAFIITSPNPQSLIDQFHAMYLKLKEEREA